MLEIPCFDVPSLDSGPDGIAIVHSNGYQPEIGVQGSESEGVKQARTAA